MIELLVAVAIVAVLASVALPMAEVAVQRTREQELRQSLREIRSAIDAYKQAVDEGRIPRQVDQSGYPPSLGALVEGVPDVSTPDRKMIYFLRRLPRDPFAGDEDVSPENTWGKRSYESAPDEPHEGRDIFDVYSRSSAVGLNGVPYRDW